MKKTSFLTLEKAKEIIQEIPTPFHIYDTELGRFMLAPFGHLVSTVLH